MIARKFSQNQPFLSLLKGSLAKTNPKTLFSTKRPLSPHITIYSFPLTSLLSIGHRTTGVMLGSMVYTFGVLSAIYTIDVSKTIQWIKTNVPRPLVIASKFFIAMPYTFHFSNGIRHLVAL